MKWSWTIGRVAGIALRIHATFLLLLVWLGLAYYQQRGEVVAVLQGLIFILAIFASVVLHELGHALAARRYGVATRDITLLPIGGVARLERMPDNPRQELVIALAGPAVTLVIALLLLVALRLAGAPLIPAVGALQDPTLGVFVAQLMIVNALLLGFNLLPAFPMDGGRVLRALLAFRMDYVRATAIASTIGKSFALIFGMVGLMYNPFLVLIALFVWLGAAAEASDAQFRSALTGVPVRDVMVTDLRVLSSRDTLDVALEHVLSGFQQDFPVLDDGRLAGVLHREQLMEGLAKRGRDSVVADSMERSFETVDPGDAADSAVTRLRRARKQSIPVVAGGTLRGLLTMENVSEYVMINAALRESSR